MALQVIDNGESGLDVRNALNSMFAELYSSVYTPIKITTSSTVTQGITANTFVNAIYITPVSGLVTLRIGYTPGGNEILFDTPITGVQPIQVGQLFTGAGTLYFTFSSGTGTLKIRIDTITNFN